MNIVVQIQFYYFFLNQAALHQAVYKGNTEIVKLLMTNDKLDINIHNIF